MSRIADVAKSFGYLGLTSFGGPTAHLGYFRNEFVEKKKWLSDRTYADVVALAQFLPGPASSQVGMALGYHRASWPGMALSWFLFTAPSALVLAFFGLFLAGDQNIAESGWIAGLLAAAVGVVFHAVSAMAKSMANTALTATIAVAAAIAVLAIDVPWTMMGVILIAGIIGFFAFRGDKDEADDTPEFRPVSQGVAIACLVLFFGLLFALRPLGFDRAAAYYESGALVFGGGHVVLPLLESYAVGDGWMTQQEFLAGYSVAQAVPGPLFTFASYLGAVDGGVWGSVLATVMIFLPSFLLMTAGLHFWHRFDFLRPAFKGANAAVVGLLLAALYDPVFTHGVTNIASLAIAAVTWLALAQWKLPPWAVMAGAALAGWILL
ncbi:chromate efflux transporter [Corynebacterium breve]|uniref:Chromate efflux transporter n=1 Tax=Corynebacterium breve TaxID=3049799 RepID=A0ABY8VC10_9CORY|nr:chromate efflux transporter [Corynebacterium breve]WIM67209.1 chromate efflux transporter [Corynebacterium breve]